MRFSRLPLLAAGAAALAILGVATGYIARPAHTTALPSVAGPTVRASASPTIVDHEAAREGADPAAPSPSRTPTAHSLRPTAHATTRAARVEPERTVIGKVSVRVADEPSGAGRLTQVLVSIDVASGEVRGIGLDIGDGAREPNSTLPYYAYKGLPTICLSPPSRPGHRVTAAFPVAWRTAATRQVRVDVFRAPPCESDDGRTDPDTAKHVDVEHRVVGSTEHTNGPQAPELHGFLEGQWKTCDSACVSGYAKDADGSVASISVDWRDGTSSELYHRDRPCGDPGQHWPSDFQHGYSVHNYLGPPPDHVTLIVVTSGCAGHDAERMTRDLEWFEDA